MSEFVVITGLSGAGRSQAADSLEDTGWFVIDNLPPSLIPKVAELAAGPGSTYDQVVLVVGTGPFHHQVLPSLHDLRSGVGRLRILYLEASTEVLVRRYETSRRRHPLHEDGRTLEQAIDAERRLLEAVRAEADVVIDTSDLNVHQLRDRMMDLFSSDSESQMQIMVQSFGFKHGIPLDVDIVLDCRFLPNPHWVERLRSQTGRDAEVRDYVFGEPVAVAFLDQIRALVDLLIPAYVSEGKAYLTVAFGCTGGRHRSVAIAESLFAHLGESGLAPHITHRDLDRE